MQTERDPDEVIAAWTLVKGDWDLGALKAEVERRWGTIDLLDILKDTAFITGFTDSFTSVASRDDRGPAAAWHRRRDRG